MAKDNREIIRGVRLNGTTYTSGQEDELQAVLSPEQIKRFASNGTLEGDWGQGKDEESESDAESGESTEGDETTPTRGRRSRS